MNVFNRYLTEAEERTLTGCVAQFASVLSRRDLAWMKFLLKTGMRIGEFASLTCGAARCALATGWILVPKELRKGKGVDLTLEVSVTMREALETLLTIHQEMGGNAADDAPLLLSRKHQGMSVRAFQERTARWSRAAGLPPGVSPHWFRHTRGMRIMQKSTARDPRGLAKDALGHQSIESTAIYTRPSKEDMAAMVRELDPPRVRKGDVRAAYRQAGVV
jgi:site-specific recombinase XerC